MSSKSPNKQSLYFGGLLILVGVLFLLSNARIINFDFLFNNFWPILLIAVGVLIIYTSSINKSTASEHTTFGDRSETASTDFVDMSTTFGELKVILDNQSFKGGKLNVTFGELTADMTKTKLDKGHNLLTLTATFGEITLSCPKDLPVRIVASNVAGDIKIFDQKLDGFNKRLEWTSDTYESSDTKLDVTCNLVFGEIKVW